MRSKKIKKSNKKLKDEVHSLEKEIKVEGKKLSKHEKNQLLLSNAYQKKNDQTIEYSDIEYSDIEKSQTRTFICRCGCEVKLHGNIDLYIKECTQCSKEK